MRAVKMTEEKVRKLLPIVESILSREYGRKVTLKDLTVGGITVYKKRLRQIAQSCPILYKHSYPCKGMNFEHPSKALVQHDTK